MVVITAPLSTASGVNDVFIAEDRYAILATTSGVEVVDLFCGVAVSSGTLGSEPLSVAADFTTATGSLYVGTTSSGIYSARWHPLREPGRDFTGELVQRFTTTTTPPVSDNRINDLSALPGHLLISTASGIDIITDEALVATRPLSSGSEDCQMTADGEAYWTVVNSGVEANYDLFPSSGTGIITVDFEYNATTSNPLLPHNVTRDIAVVPGNPNLLAFATGLGAFIVEEQQFAEASSQTRTLLPAAGPTISVGFSEDATFSGGTIYVATADVVRVIGLLGDILWGVHMDEGRLAEANAPYLQFPGNQALVSGTVTVLRTTNIA